MNDVLIELGVRIKNVRKERHMSQLDLSLESGLNKNYISDLEKGRRNPTLKVLLKIAYALNIDLSILLKGIH